MVNPLTLIWFSLFNAHDTTFILGRSLTFIYNVIKDYNRLNELD